jgi:CHAT domain-containing protein/tetratricopeptide (TPR) repeat protein
VTRNPSALAAGLLAAVAVSGCYSAPTPEGLLGAAEALRLQYDPRATQEAIAKYRSLQLAWRDSDKRAAARAGQGLGAAFEQLGALGQSLQAYSEGLVIAEASGDLLLASELHSDVGTAQAQVADRTALLDQAEGHCRTAWDTARRMGGIRQEAKAFHCLGDVMYSQGGKLEPALENYRQAERLWNRLGDSRGLALASLAQGWVHSDMRQFDQAQTYFTQARSGWTALGDKRQLAITFVADARLLMRRGDYQEAVQDFDKALALLEPMGDAIWQGASLTGKGEIYSSMAEVPLALVYWERSLAAFDSSGLKTFSVDVLMSLGKTLLASGDELGALARFERALALANELGNLRWQALAQRNIGSVHLSRREPLLALRHLNASLALARSLDDRKLHALILADAGEAQQLLNNHERALSYFAEALAVSRGAEDREGVARVLSARGALQERQGRFASARQNLDQAMSDRVRLFGAGHPLVAETRAALARVDFAAGASPAALAAALSAETASRDHLRDTLRYLPERQGLRFAEKRPRGLDLAISIVASRSVTSVTPVFDGVIQARGIVLDELAARNRTADPIDSRAASLYAGARQARQRFANLLVRSLQEPVARTLFDEARQQKEAAERALVEQSAEARAEMARAATGFDAVLEALPPGSALVSFVQYQRSLPPPERRSGPPAAPIPAFAAFVLHATGTAAVVPLGNVFDVERLITEWREEAAGKNLLGGGTVGRADLAYRTVGTRLRRAIWDPLAGRLRGANRVFVVPDGAIGLVSLAALPVGTSYLLEHAPPIHYLSAERDLVSGPSLPSAGATGMIALGGPSFDDTPRSGPQSAATSGKTPSAATAAGTRGAGTGCLSFENLRFQPLDGTLQEVQEISNVWTRPATPRTEAARVLVGREASETTFKRDAHRYQVLHLATHGFFLSSGCSAAPGTNTRGVGGLSSAGTVENPLLLSGLALAGANRRASAGPDEDDGILTAEEVASLDLSGVEWAVLSACDTGVGEIRAGEGVFGLRRAFQVAGARTVVMSLWSVDDQATRAWMRALYEGRFQRALSTADAVHQASLSVLRDRRAKGLSTHPFYWAAFVAAGDWR